MSHDNLPVKDPDLGHSVANPGLEEEVPRYVDVDKAAGDRVYRGILMMLGAVPLLAIAFVVIYFAVPRDMYIDFGILTANAQNVGFGLTGGLIPCPAAITTPSLMAMLRRAVMESSRAMMRMTAPTPRAGRRPR